MMRILDKFKHHYGIDLICDPELIPFYEKFGMKPMTGMVIRNYDQQARITAQRGLDMLLIPVRFPARKDINSIQ